MYMKYLVIFFYFFTLLILPTCMAQRAENTAFDSSDKVQKIDFSVLLTAIVYLLIIKQKIARETRMQSLKISVSIFHEQHSTQK